MGTTNHAANAASATTSASANQRAPFHHDFFDDATRLVYEPGKRGSLGWMKPPVIVAVAIGGALGTLARVSIDFALVAQTSSALLSVLAVNLLGALALGLALGHGMAEQPLWAREGLTTGVLGSFTTMSGIALVTLNVAPPVAVVYLVGTFVLGVAAAALGWLLGQRLRPQRRVA